MPSVADRNRNTTIYTYYDIGKVIEETSPEYPSDPIITELREYDISGNLISVTKPKGNCRIMDYDGFGRLIKVTDDPTTPKDTHASASSANLVTTYEYDNNNNLVHTRTPKDNSGSTSDVEYTYDNQNRKTKHIQHQGGLPDITTRYTSYDNNGNLKELIDPNGRYITYDYDTLNRQTDASYQAVSSPYYETTHIKTEYDKNNNVTRITETKSGAAGSLTDITDNSEYDNFDRLKTTTERGKTIHYDYDVNGNRTLVSSNAGSTTYSYDARNRLEWADQNTHKTFYTYYPDDRPDTVTFPNGTETVYTYYPETHRVKTITNTVVLANSVISSFEYTYDPNGNRTRQIEVQSGVSETTDYSFDTLDRMTGYTLSGADTLITGYTFEGYNRKSETVIKNALITTSREYTYNDVNWLTKIDDTTDNANPFTIDYAYDNNGNTIHKSNSSLTNQDITYTYDSRNQLVQVTRGPPASLELLGQYDYNADGLRVRHKNSERGNVNYFYDGNSVLEERSADTDTLLAHYRYADRLLSLDTGAEVQYYLNDALGSTVNLTTDVGSVKVSYWLDPYGEIRKQEGISVNRMVFTGQEHDEKTGLVYFGARYYDPDTARFITQDSYLGESGTPPSLNRYLYGYSNPTVYVDLFGYDNVRIGEGGKFELIHYRNVLGYKNISLSNGNLYYDFKDVKYPVILTKESKNGSKEWFKALVDWNRTEEKYRTLFLAHAAGRNKIAAAKYGSVAATAAVTGPAALTGLSDKALYAYVAATNSKIINYGIKALSAYHIYNFATDKDYAGASISFDSGTGVSSIYSAADDILNTGRNIIKSKAVTKIARDIKNSAAEKAYEFIESAAQKTGAKQYVIHPDGTPEFRKINKSSESGIDYPLKRPSNVTDAQWQIKMDALNKASAEGRAKVVYKPNRSGNAQREARKQGLIDKGDHADHGLDLQFGGEDTIDEIISTNPRVNTSVGGQGKKRLLYPDGTPINRFIEEE